ncbi:hypothetical protein [Vibrio vulnificus]|uniref:hypothetical protein n=1 Tax=Vibrio vulnificus TaxID=672 RepID=UPI002FD48A40
MSDPVFQALVESNRRLAESVENKMGDIDQTLSGKITELDEKFENEKNAFYSLGNFKNKRLVVPWVGDSTHYNYILLHMEPSADENPYADAQTSGAERYGFGQYGEIFVGRITSSYAAVYFARFLFHSVRGFNDVSSAKVETPFSHGLATPVIVKNFPHDGKLFRAIRIAPQSSQYNGLNISVNYYGDFRGTGGADRYDPTNNPYWLKNIGVHKDETQPGEVVV